jgi:hypothetical protein
MRWERLFADLEAQLEAAAAAELEGEVAERTRGEAAALRLVDRARPAEGGPVRLTVTGYGELDGALVDVSAEWLLVARPGLGEALVPWPAVTSIFGLGPDSAVPGTEGRVAARLRVTTALRAIARDRSPVTLRLRDGSGLTGTIDRVGADFVELAEHDLAEPRRGTNVSRQLVVPVAALAVVLRA